MKRSNQRETYVVGLKYEPFIARLNRTVGWELVNFEDATVDVVAYGSRAKRGSDVTLKVGIQA
jgi:hypothetical protein